MKVIALNSSPRDEGISKTGMLLGALVEGMSEAGAHVETIHLRQEKINNCMGCFTCWSKSPGVCIHKVSDGKYVLEVLHPGRVNAEAVSSAQYGPAS
ncbi:MAG: hypothetical protein ABSH41_21455 [Syntrophobacteraceae bacterium]|jgi:multimeric flavodoxin WrbA